MRVLVTRAEADAARTARALEARGHEAVLAPVLRIVPQRIEPPIEPVDAALATSAHAFIEETARGERLRRRPLFAVGHATAEAARQAGYEDIRIGHGDAASLASLLALTLPRPAHVLFLAGRDRKPDLERAVVQAGYRLSVAEAYWAEAEATWPAALLRSLAEGHIAAALHYSRRSASLALELARRIGLGEAFLALAHVCLSDDVAAPLRQAGAGRVLVASAPTEAALLARLDEVP